MAGNDDTVPATPSTGTTGATVTEDGPRPTDAVVADGVVADDGGGLGADAVVGDDTAETGVATTADCADCAG